MFKRVPGGAKSTESSSKSSSTGRAALGEVAESAEPDHREADNREIAELFNRVDARFDVLD
jgi:hypothetical protein